MPSQVVDFAMREFDGKFVEYGVVSPQGSVHFTVLVVPSPDDPELKRLMIDGGEAIPHEGAYLVPVMLAVHYPDATNGGFHNPGCVWMMGEECWSVNVHEPAVSLFRDWVKADFDTHLLEERLGMLWAKLFMD